MTVDAPRRSMETFGRDVLPALGQIRAVDRATAAPSIGRAGDEAEGRSVHWSTPPDEPIFESRPTLGPSAAAPPRQPAR
jgi:hypothetical protein